MVMVFDKKLFTFWLLLKFKHSLNAKILYKNV